MKKRHHYIVRSRGSQIVGLATGLSQLGLISSFFVVLGSMTIVLVGGFHGSIVMFFALKSFGDIPLYL